MKKQTLIIFILFSLIVLYQPLFAQKGYLPGFYISNEGDTVQGLIYNKYWAKNPRTLSFKKTENDDAQTYLPGQIREFSVQGKYYESHVVMLNERDYDIEEFTNFDSLTSFYDTVFLQNVIKGEKSLYYLKTKSDDIYYFYPSGDEIQTLFFDKWLVPSAIEKDPTKYVYLKKTYIGQLTAYFQDCPEMLDQVRKTRYNWTSLSKRYLKYYRCKNLEPENVTKEVDLIELGFVAGFSLTKIYFPDYYPVYLSDAHFPVSARFLYGITMNIKLKNHQAWSSYNEFIFDSYKSSTDYYLKVNESENYEFSITQGQLFSHASTMVRYTMNLKKNIFFIDGGVSVGIVWKDFNSIKYYYNSEEGTKWGVYGSPYRSIERGFAIGIGYSFRNLSLEARYFKPVFPAGKEPDPIYPSGISPMDRIFVLIGVTI